MVPAHLLLLYGEHKFIVTAYSRGPCFSFLHVLVDNSIFPLPFEYFSYVNCRVARKEVKIFILLRPLVSMKVPILVKVEML